MAAVLCGATLVACGGGGADPSPNQMPVARAASISQALVGSQVSLDGAASTDADGDTLRHTWTLSERPTGSTAAVAAASATVAELTPDRPGRYVLTLTVDDGRSGTATTTLELQATADAIALPDGVAARASALSAVLALPNGSLQLDWKDSFPAATRYQVEIRQADGSYRALQTVTGMDGSGSVLQATLAAAAAGDYRVQALLAGRKVPLMTAQGANSLSVAVPATAPSITLDRAEPLLGTVQVGLTGTATTTVSSTVRWYADQRLVATGAPAGWNTLSETNGAHTLAARMDTAPSSSIEVRRAVSTDNPPFTATATVARSGDVVTVTLVPTSTYPVTGIAATLDGQPLGSLAAPNACLQALGCIPSDYKAWRFTLSAAAIKSGDHVLQASLSDAQGRTLVQPVAVPVSNAPTISLGSPVDDALFSGTLKVSGQVTSDTGSPLTVTATLNGVAQQQVTAGAFALNFDLSSLNPARYTLTVQAVDARGQTATLSNEDIHVLTSDAMRLQQRVATLGADFNGQFLAADGDRILIRTQAKGFVLRNTATGRDVSVAGANDSYNGNSPTSLGLSRGRVVWQGKGSDCTLASCVYDWTEAAGTRNLSKLNPWVSSGDNRPLIRGTLVLWLQRSALILFDTVTDRFEQIQPPLGLLDNTPYDFAQVGSVAKVFFVAVDKVDTKTEPFPYQVISYRVYRWDSDSRAYSKVSDGTDLDWWDTLRTDGKIVAWSENFSFGLQANMSLFSQPVGGGATRALSDVVNSFLIDGGLVAWQEAYRNRFGPSDYFVRVDSASGIKTAGRSPLIALVGGRYVVFGTQVYDTVTDTTQTRLGAGGSAYWSTTGNTLYFQVGAQKVIYKAVFN